MKFILSAILLFTIGQAFAQNTKELKVGDKIPAFQLKDQDGKTFNSASYLGKKSMVLFFYPKDESLVCTKEACAFKEKYDDFIKAGAIVAGINGGSQASHKSFQQKEKIPYQLLVDTDNKVIKSFGVPNKMFMTGRKTFVIDKTGTIVFAFDSSLNGSKHAEETLAFLRK